LLLVEALRYKREGHGFLNQLHHRMPHTTEKYLPIIFTVLNTLASQHDDV